MNTEIFNSIFGLSPDSSLTDIQVFFKQSTFSYQILNKPADTNGKRYYIVVAYMTTGRLYGFKTLNPSSCLPMFKFCNKIPLQLELSPKNFKFLEQQLDYIFNC
jgi:hypothetical protein